MADHRLTRRVGDVLDRLQKVCRLKAQARIWLMAGGVFGLMAGALWLSHRGGSIPAVEAESTDGASETPAPVITLPGIPPSALLALGGGVLIIGSWLARRRTVSLHDAAVAIESRWPELDSRLVTAMDQRPEAEEGGFRYLQQEVIQEALLHAHRHDWAEAVPSQKILSARLQQLACGLLFGTALVAAYFANRAVVTRMQALAGVPTGPDAATYRVLVDPGDVSLERGTSLLVLARFGTEVPRAVTLHAHGVDGSQHRIPLDKSLDDPVFGGRIAEVHADLAYHVEYDGHTSPEYRVTTFEFPTLLKADATIVHPEYTGLGERTIEDVRRVSLVAGSQLTLTCELNKPVDTAILRGANGTTRELQPVRPARDGSQPDISAAVYACTWTPAGKQTWHLELTDEADRRNKQPIEFTIDVIPNLPPELKVAFPGKDIRVSPIEELSLEATARDDFGLREFGIVYQLPEREEQTLKLGEGGAADADVALAHQLALEEWKAEPNELVAYYFYADDHGPDGAPRRAFSDLYFAEVRHFDEEYRQAMSSSAGGAPPPGSGGPSVRLLKLQRDIVHAVWNVLRRETAAELSATFEDDVQTIAESQAQAIELAGTARERITDLLSQQFLNEALEAMTATGEQLDRALDPPAAAPLSPARESANAAYRALLKLNEREHLVQQMQASAGMGQSDQSDRQLNQQLNQLELKNNRNRYETARQDQPQENQEQLQVLNRLRELARQQNDLNEKIQELEHALREAASEQEQREIERQLKRLQEEQQQMLRDLDELQERMNQPVNRSQMADARKQVEQTREHLLRTSEALKEGQLSQALNSGTRAARDLDQLRDEFRQRASGQFSDEMRELRQQARALADRQQELSRQLTGQSPDPTPQRRPQLKDDARGPSFETQVSEQRERLNDLMEQVRNVIQESEVSEPLLSKKLYDAVRNTRVDQPEESLAMTEQFLKHGLRQQAAQTEAQARRGVEKLRDGIEQAAESVLGDEKEALRRAQQDLQSLSQAIGAELAQADPELTAPREPQRQAAGPGSQSDAPRPAEEPSGEARANRPSGATPAQDAGQQPAPEGSPEGDRPGQPGQRSQPSGTPGSERQASPPSGPRGTPQGSPGSESSPSGSPETPGSATAPEGGALAEFLRQARQDGLGGGGGPEIGALRPLSGGDFRQWSDRMRDLEEMLDNAELRGDVARIRDRARELRIESNRHSKPPNWELVRTTIYGPMLELQQRIAEELLRREPGDRLVPLDRDPVPDRYTQLVERYYEQLGSGR
jgi:hypothetical protein